MVQINLHHSKMATCHLALLMVEKGLDVALIQEPWVKNDVIHGLRLKNYSLFYSKGRGKPRTCILVNNKNKVFLMPNFSDQDITTVKWERRGGAPLMLSSVYMAHDAPIPSADVQNIVESARTERVNLILGCDANAHHTLWGSTDINERGEYLFNFVITTNLNICNTGNTPTFVTANREEVLDVTFANESGDLKVDNWRVSSENSFSDHRWILFDVGASTNAPEPFRNPKKTDWDKFCRIVFDKLAEPPEDLLPNAASIDNAVNKLTESLMAAFVKSCPISRPAKKSYPPWWNVDLNGLRRNMRKLFNKAKSKRTEDESAYREALKTYKKAIRKAQRKSWQDYSERVESTNEAARLRKVLSKEPSAPSFLRKTDGAFTASSEETLKLLIDAHFPGNTLAMEAPIDQGQPPDLNSIKSVVTNEKLEWAIDSFDPYKSPGLDGIMPAMLQKGKKILIPWLLVIYRSSLYHTHLPASWNKIKIVFIPKAGRSSHATAKDFRPISLSSFLTKTLERLLDTQIKNSVPEDRLSLSQHAYTKGKSVETALHEVVGAIEKSLRNKEYTLGTFIDIEGAFNNVTTEAVCDALVESGVDNYICRWIHKMLKGRVICSKLGSSEIARIAGRGTPQGGVLSPTLWLRVMNKLLIALERAGFKVIAYADDLVILVSGKYLNTIGDLTETALRKLERWAAKCGLRVNQEKTELVLFTRRRVIENFRLPVLGNSTLVLKERAKYLGLILDSKLNWGMNLQERVKKASVAFYACKKAIGKKWGLKPHIVHWIYTAIVRPILTYGVLVWWTALEKAIHIKKLTKVQRAACLGVTGALHSAPTAALEVMLHLIPMDIYVKSVAAKSALRLKESKCWTSTNYGHSSILRIYPGQEWREPTDYTVSLPDFEKSFSMLIPGREQWEGNQATMEVDHSVFTDGSKMDVGVGAGVFSESMLIQRSYRLPDYCSIFQAEIFAVDKAVNTLRDHAGLRGPASIAIYIDSQAAIKAICSNSTKSKLVRRCRNNICALGTQHRITLCWVPGHSNILGNETADALARAGASMSVELAENTVARPLGSVKEEIDRIAKQLAQSRWTGLTTCSISRQLWPVLDNRKTAALLQHSRRDLRNITAVITGHCLFGRHAERMQIPTNDFCRSCRDEEEEESIQHFLCECPGLARRRFNALGEPFFNDLEEVSSLQLGRLTKFINSSGWFE